MKKRKGSKSRSKKQRSKPKSQSWQGSAGGVTRPSGGMGRKNAKFIDYLKKATPADKKKVAAKIIDSEFLSVTPDRDFLKGLFTQKGDNLEINPVIVKFGMEEFSDYVYQNSSITDWMEYTGFFIGEIIFDRLNEGNDFTGVSLEKLLEDYYKKTGLGPVPDSYQKRLSDYYKFANDRENRPDVKEEELVYYNLIKNLGLKLQRLLDGNNNKKIFYFLDKFFTIHKYYKDNPAYFSANNRSSIRFSQNVFLGSIYLAAFQRYVLDANDFKKAAEALKLYSDDINLFLGAENEYSGAVEASLSFLTNFAIQLLNANPILVGSTVNIPKILGLLLNFALDLNPTMVDRKALLQYANFVAFDCSLLMMFVDIMKANLGDEYNPLTYKPDENDQRYAEAGESMRIKVKDLHRILMNMKTGLLKCIDLLEASIEENFDDVGDEVRELINQLTKLSSYELQLEENRAGVLKLWEDAINFFQKQMDKTTSPPDLIRAGYLYATIFLANFYFDASPITGAMWKYINQTENTVTKDDLKKIRTLLKNCYDDVKYMEDLAVEKHSVTAFELVVWYYEVMGLYSKEIGNTKAVARASKKERKFEQMGKKYGLDTHNFKKNFNWDL